MDVPTIKIKPFDAFTNVYKLLNFTGLYKLIKKPNNRYLLICHQIYRPIALSIIVIYNIFHLEFILQMYLIGDIDNLFEGLTIDIAHLNLLSKVINLNVKSFKLDKLNELINSPHFAPRSKKDKEYIVENIKTTNKLWVQVMIGVTATALFWILSPIVKRIHDENTIPATTYIPFETQSWLRFLLAVALESVALPWTSYGYIAVDFIIGVYYFQAETQLKIIKHNLEHLVDNEVINDLEKDVNFRYIDEVDESVHDRFVNIVKRYEKVTWYIKELSDVFTNSVTFQFVSTSSAMCLTVYKLSLMNDLSVTFAFLVMYLLVIQIQILTYCYFGGMVKYESDSVSTAAYMTDWLSLSPKFRKQLAIAMTRWGLQITPRVSIIIPLSLTTFITILRSSYTLLTVLKTANSYNIQP